MCRSNRAVCATTTHLRDNTSRMLDRFLMVSDSTRAFNVLERLAQHRTESWALTGGLAIEIYALRGGLTPQIRSLNDLDFTATDFADIPETLGRHFLFRHVHPREVPGRTMIQLVDVVIKLRIDVFRATGASSKRAGQLVLPTGKIKIVALEDLIARTARLALDLDGGFPIPAKHAADFLRLAHIIRPQDVQSAWSDHRRPEHPLAFKDARQLLLELIPKRKDLLVVPTYSKDVSAGCPRCVATSAFPLADPQAIVSALGYC